MTGGTRSAAGGVFGAILARPVRAGLLAAALAVAACSTREPTNPLDPDNPDTGGQPRWLDALADDGAVDLAWSVPAYDDLAWVVLRDDDDAVLWSGPAGADSWRVDGAINGVEAGFRLELWLEGGRVLPLPEEIAEPGPETPWALDPSSALLHRLTPDGRRSRLAVPAPDAALARVDPATGGVLVVDFYAGRVRRLDRDGALLWSAGGFERPLGALRTGAGWWIADPGAGTVTLLDDAGGLAARDTTFVFPVDVAEADSGRVWVADNEGRVALLDPADGVLTEYRGLAVPDVIVGDGEGGTWIADGAGQGLVRIDRGAKLVAAAGGFLGVAGLAPDPVLAGGVWVAERGRRAVLLLDGSGVETAAIEGLPAPSTCAVSPDGATIWVADPVLGAVLRFSRDGTERSRSTGVAEPVTVTVAFTRPVR